MNPALLVLRGLGSGAVAGLTALAVDLVLARQTLGYWVPLRLSYLLVYLLAGSAIALLVTAWRPRTQPLTVLATCFALTYMPSLVERVYQAVVFRAGNFTAWSAALAVGLLYAGWLLLLVLLCRPRSYAWAWSLGGAAAAVILAVNRNTVDRPLEPAAVLVDLAVVGLVIAIAVLLRRSGLRAAVAASAGAVLAGLVGLAMLRSTGEIGPQSGTEHADRPHLLLIIIDTVRQDVFRHVVETTPEGQAFAEILNDAAFFDNAMAAAPWTAPSVGSIMTGLYPDQHGFGRTVDDPNRPLQRLSSTVPTLAEHLREHGYFNLAVGTNTVLHTASGIDRGFHRYEVLQLGTEKLPLVTDLVRLGWRRPELYQPAEAVRRRLRDHLDSFPQEHGPVFIWLHLMDPHFPLNHHPQLSPAPGESDLDPEDRLYQRELRYALGEVGRMIDLYRERLPWDQTVLVVVGDHGEMFPSDGHDSGVPARGGGPMLQGHGHALYEELVHVPLVVRPPGGVPGGARLPVLVSHVDLAGTVTDLLGVPGFGKDDERISVASLGAGEEHEQNARRWAWVGATQRGPTQYGMRGAGLKIIHYPDGERPDEVYDLSADPLEQNNVAGSQLPDVAEAFTRLEAYLLIDPVQPDAGAVDLDADTRESLEALGYLDGN